MNFTLMAPFYDAIASPFLAMRYRSIELADVKSGDRVLLVGAGTGADIPLLPRTAQVSPLTILLPCCGRRPGYAASMPR